jgi:HEAT repeat protein
MAKKQTRKSESSSKRHSSVPPKASTGPSAKAETSAKPKVVLVAPNAPAKDISPLVNDLGSSESSKRSIAAAALGRSGERAAVQPLVAALRDSDADVAHEAAAALGTLGDASGVSSLIDVVRNVDGFYHGVVRAAAAGSLAQLKDTRAVDALIVAVRDPMAEPSAEAIRALAALKDERAVGVLVEVVRNRDGFFLPVARRAAVSALKQFKNTEATATLREVAADSSEDAVIRAEAN